MPLSHGVWLVIPVIHPGVQEGSAAPAPSLDECSTVLLPGFYSSGLPRKLAVGKSY